MSSSSRLAWLDIARGIGLILVVLGHNVVFMEGNPYWHKYVYTFHMPLFFFLTGCTLSFGHARSSLRRSLSVAVPYVVMSLTLLPITLHTKPEAELADILLGIVYGSSWTIDSIPLWFLSCTAVALLIAASIDALFIKQGSPQSSMSRRNIMVLGLAAFALIALSAPLFSFLDIRPIPQLAWGSIQTSGLIWNAEIAICATGYMIAGRLFFEFSTPFQKINPWGLILLSLILFLLIDSIIRHFDVKFDLNHRYFVPGDWVIFMPFMGIAAVLFLALAIERTPWPSNLLAMIGQSGIIILWLHSRLENRAFNALASSLAQKVPAEVYWALAIAFAVAIPVLLDRFVIKRSAYLKMLFYPRFKRLFS